MQTNWLGWVLAQLAVGLLVAGLYVAAAWLSPRLFKKSFPIQAGGRTVAVRRGATQEEVRRLFGPPLQENPTAVRKITQWVYRFPRDAEQPTVFFFEGDRLDAVQGPGEHRPAPFPGRRR